ncbi:MAG: hypothetical protein GY696_08505, partial [Gammaproteobacteria bacterium]|nr:hypothetical protein [Gammaproteobacteria bacterium]
MQYGNQRYVPIITEVDKGAKPSTINMATYREHFGSVKLKPIHGSCTNYDGSNTDGLHGYITTRMLFGGRNHRDTLPVQSLLWTHHLSIWNHARSQESQTYLGCS